MGNALPPPACWPGWLLWALETGGLASHSHSLV